MTLTAISMLQTNVSAQSINIDLGAGAGGSPADTYAGAGLAGHWNSISGGQSVYQLNDLSGQPTGVTLTNAQTFLTLPIDNPHPATAGDPNTAALFDDFFLLDGDIGSQFEFAGLDNGMYDLIVYGIWVGRPKEPTAVYWISDDLMHDEFEVIGDEPFNGLEQGVTHSRFRVPVTDGTLRFEALGIFTIGLESYGNLNGIQLVQVPTPGAACVLGAGLLGMRRRRRQ